MKFKLRHFFDLYCLLHKIFDSVDNNTLNLLVIVFIMAESSGTSDSSDPPDPIGFIFGDPIESFDNFCQPKECDVIRFWLHAKNKASIKKKTRNGIVRVLTQKARNAAIHEVCHALVRNWQNALREY